MKLTKFLFRLYNWSAFLAELITNKSHRKMFVRAMFMPYSRNLLVARRPQVILSLFQFTILFFLLIFVSCKKGSPGDEGDGGTDPKSTPDDTFLQVATSETNTMAIDSKNVLWGAGDNRGAVLGVGNKNKYTSYVRLTDQVKAVSLSDSRSIIIKNDNSVWTAGSNSFGELGIGNAVSNGTFVKVADDALQIEAGNENGFIIKADHTLWASGFNYYEIFGSNNSPAVSVVDSYQKIAENVQSISAGQAHFLMLKTDGSLWGCGQNVEGQLGIGTYTYRRGFIKIMDGVKAIEASSYHSLIIKTDNSLWATGHNSYGELGIGNNTAQTQFVKVMDGASALAGGRFFSMVIKTDGTLWASGYNNQTFGIVSPDQNKFIKVSDNVTAIAAAEYHSLMIKNDKTMWATGSNTFGEIGAGAEQSLSTFTKVKLK
jgi:alpha-tubulin suppressor-like RCC1 family protein